MFNRILRKNFSSKLYSNVANLQKLKTFKLPLNTLDKSNEINPDNQTLNSNTENYLKALKLVNEKIKQVKSNQNKLKEIQNDINENYLKKNNKIKYDNHLTSFEYSYQLPKKVIQKDQQKEIKVMANKDSISLKLKEYKKVKENLNDIRKTISNCVEIMDLSQKLNNEKYGNKSVHPKKPSTKEITLNNKYDEEKLKNDKKQTIIKNSHLYELHYHRIPFANFLLTPHKYTTPFINYNKENTLLNSEFDHEQEILNNEIHNKLLNTIENEMKDFKLSHITSNTSIFNDQIKNPSPVGFILQESNREIDYDASMETEKLYYVVNQEDDFGITMYKEEAERKKPTETVGVTENEEDMVMMSTAKNFPFTVDGKAFVLVKNNSKL